MLTTCQVRLLTAPQLYLRDIAITPPSPSAFKAFAEALTALVERERSGG